MSQPGKAGVKDGSPKARKVGNKSSQSLPSGYIQKISQEGRKNTYVIIVNQDCIKSETSKGPPVIKHPPVLGKKHDALANHPILQTFSDHNSHVSDREFDSPVCSSTVNVNVKCRRPTEDVKLNLSNINDDEYDSNCSAKNVFLRPETSSDQDSAIEIDMPEYQLQGPPNSRSFYCEKNRMNTYVIPSPLSAQQQQGKSKQHTFPMISPQGVGQRQSKINYSSVNSDTSNNSSGRKIYLVTPTSSSTPSGGSVLQKSVAYTNEAVPVMGRSKINSLQQHTTHLPNSKAVPTVKNVSPIGATSSSFVPINPAASPSLGYTQGPLTSTPIGAEPVNPRLQQLRYESATHRPVYVIPSPFSKNSATSTGSPSSHSRSQSLDSNPEHLEYVQVKQGHESMLNNSSGFISASSSLEMPDSSCSFDDAIAKPATDTDTNKMTFEIAGEEDKYVPYKFSSDDGSGGVVISSDADYGYTELDKDLGVGLESEYDPSLTSSQDSEASDTSEKGGLNRSLTNIQWLKGMQLKEKKPSTQQSSTRETSASQTIQWKTLTPEEIRKISSECGKDTRPPFSYMAMIQMALYSRDDRRMMLKEICKWIEETFLYYKYTAKPGWKNSIRHNLSLYNIFEREPAKRHGSYWTIKPDMEPRTKQYKERHCHKTAEAPSTRHSSPSLPSQPGTPGGSGVIPIIPMYSSMGQLSAITPQPICLPQQSTTSKKKGPPPILPRPASYSPASYSTPQAYALIPITSMSSGLEGTIPPGQNQMFVNPGSQNSSACPSPGISEMSAAVASIQMSCNSPIPTEQLESNIQREHIYTKKPHLNIIRQAWENQNMDTASSLDSDLTSSNDIASSSELSGARPKSKRPRDRPGLPKPVIYSKDEEAKSKRAGSKRRKLQQQERKLNESSDEENEAIKLIRNLEKDIDMLTSTPNKTANSDFYQLPSPIKGLTPLRNNDIFEGSLLDTLEGRKELGLSPDGSSPKGSINNGSHPFNDSPNESLLDLNELPVFTSTDKSPEGNTSLNNQNLSRILLDYGLDPSNTDMGPEAFPNLNWSYVQQMVDNFDAPEKVPNTEEY